LSDVPKEETHYKTYKIELDLVILERESCLSRWDFSNQKFIPRPKQRHL